MFFFFSHTATGRPSCQVPRVNYWLHRLKLKVIPEKSPQTKSERKVTSSTRSGFCVLSSMLTATLICNKSYPLIA